MLRKLFGSKNTKLPGEWRGLHIGHLHDFRPHQTLFGMSYQVGRRGGHDFVYLWEREQELIWCL